MWQKKTAYTHDPESRGGVGGSRSRGPIISFMCMHQWSNNHTGGSTSWRAGHLPIASSPPPAPEPDVQLWHSYCPPNQEELPHQTLKTYREKPWNVGAGASLWAELRNLLSSCKVLCLHMQILLITLCFFELLQQKKLMKDWLRSATLSTGHNLRESQINLVRTYEGGIQTLTGYLIFQGDSDSQAGVGTTTKGPVQSYASVIWWISRNKVLGLSSDITPSSPGLRAL